MAGQADGRILVDSAIDPQGFETGSKRLQSAVKSLSTKVESLGTTFQKALGGNPKALETFQAKAAELQQTVDRLAADMAKLGAKKAPTDAYKDLSAETEKAGSELEKLLNKQEKLDNRGTSKTSQTYKNLQADIAAASARYDELAAKKAQMEADGTAWTSGTETAEYQSMAAAVDAANARLGAMRERIEEASSASHGLSSVLQRLPSPLSVAKSVFGGILSVVKSIGSAVGKVAKGVLNLAKNAAKKLLSVFKSILSTVKKLFVGHKSLSGSVGNLTSTLKKLIPAMLAARGVMGILRKGVNAFLEANEQVSNQLQACWGSLGNILGPIITRIVNLVATAISYVTAFLRLLGFGVSGGGASTISAMGKAVTSVGNATKTATSGTAAYGKTAIAAYGAAGNAARIAAVKTDEFGNKSAVAFNAVGGAATIAADEINTVGDAAESTAKKIQNLSGLDQLNTWKSEQDAGGGGGGGAGGGIGDLGVTLPEVELPDWAKLLAEQLRNGEWEAAAKTLSDKLNEMVDSVDWPGLGDRLGEKMAGVLKFLATFIREFDFVDLFTGLFTTLEHAIDKLDAEDLGALLAAKFVLIFSALQGAVESGVIPTAIEKLGGAIEGFFKTIREKFNDESDPAHGGWYVVGQNFGNVIGQIINSIASLLSGTNWNQIVGDIGEFWSGLWNALRNGSNAPDWGRLFDAIQTACKRLLVRMLQWLPQSSESKKTWQDLESRLEKGGDSVSWGDIFRALWHTLGDLVRLLIDNIPSVGELKKYWNSLKDELAQALGYANWKSLSADFKNKIVEVLTSAFNMAGDALYNALKESHPKWAAALFPEQARIEEAAEQFRKDYDKNLSTALGNLNLTIQDMILSGGNADVLKEQAIQIIGDVTGVYLNSYDDIYTAMESGVLQPTVDAMYDGTELAFQAGDAVGEAASNGVDAGAREGAAASGATWLAENFSDAVANCKAAMAQGGSEAGAQFINALVDEGSLNIGEAAQLAQEVANQLKNEGSQFAAAAQSLADEYNGKLLENVPGARAAGTALGDASAGAASGVAEASADMSTAAETAAQTVAPAIEAEQGSARTAGEAVGAAATEGAGEGIEGFEDTVSGAIEGSAGRAGAGARVLRNRVHNEIRPMRPEVAAEFEGMGSDMSDSFSSSSSSVGSTAQSMASTIRQVLSSMQSNLASVLATMKSGLTSNYQAMKSTVTTNMTAIKTTSSTNWESIKTTAVNTGSSVKSSVTSNWTSIRSSLTESLQGIATSSSENWASIKSNTSEANSSIKSSVSSSWSGITSTISSQMNSVKSTVSSTFSSLKSSAYSWGSDFGSQLASGIRSAISRIASAASSAAATARSYLHFSVPDKGPLADADEYGPDFIKLLAEGMTKNQSLAARAASRVATAISAGIQDGEYTLPEIQVSQVDAAMDTFGDRITAGFSSMVDRLQAIADSITFRLPTVATAGAIPYSVTGSSAPTKADNELLSSIRQITAKVDALSRSRQGGQYVFKAQLNSSTLFQEVIAEGKLSQSRTGRNPFELGG